MQGLESACLAEAAAAPWGRVLLVTQGLLCARVPINGPLSGCGAGGWGKSAGDSLQADVELVFRIRLRDLEFNI